MVGEKVGKPVKKTMRANQLDNLEFDIILINFRTQFL